MKSSVDLFFISFIKSYRLLEPEGKTLKLLENISSYSPNITVSHPRGLESSAAPPWGLYISHCLDWEQCVLSVTSCRDWTVTLPCYHLWCYSGMVRNRLNSVIFWDVTPHNLEDRHWHLIGTHLPDSTMWHPRRVWSWLHRCCWCKMSCYQPTHIT